jgi:hypothetical protein
LIEVAGTRGSVIEPKVLGKFISKNERRIEGNLRFEKNPKPFHKVVRWQAGPAP